ncbi:hypothetical protein DPR02_15145 [Burkholderia cepacia]|uniref:Uncharacterized protein n=1 Tax=Burkholderia cepacia TaxID=292 RepID=A0AAQ0FCP9_BURCE|nr:hypothetical protein DPR02_15145 [Burkholderia cepacia]
MRAFSFVSPIAPAGGRVTAERRKPPARLPAGLEGMRVHAHPRPAGCRRVPSAPPKKQQCPPCAGIVVCASGLRPGSGANWTHKRREKSSARLPAERDLTMPGERYGSRQYDRKCLRGAQPSERKTRDGSNAVAGFSCFLAAEAPVFPARARRYY